MTTNPISPEKQTILEVKNLKKFYKVRSGGLFSRREGIVRAVDSLNLTIKRGETLGLVGESGCGKTTTGRLIARLIPADEGSVIYEGRDILSLSRGDLTALRRNIQFIFQDPLSSLNPRMSIYEIITEPLLIHNLCSKKKMREETENLMEQVGLDKSYLSRFPHQLSGGQRQRILIARALSLKPSFIIADEPVSALDVSVQGEILHLFENLRENLGFSCLFISHDLAVIKHISQRIGIMYLGKIIEMGTSEEIFKNPLHPYTRDLLNSAPDINNPRIKTIGGEPPNPFEKIPGCSYHPRCRESAERCRIKIPDLQEIRPEHFAACFISQEKNNL